MYCTQIPSFTWIVIHAWSFALNVISDRIFTVCSCCGIFMIIKLVGMSIVLKEMDFCIPCKRWREFIQRMVGNTLNVPLFWTVSFRCSLSAWNVELCLRMSELFPFKKTITFLPLHCPLFTNSSPFNNSEPTPSCKSRTTFILVVQSSSGEAVTVIEVGNSG